MRRIQCLVTVLVVAVPSIWESDAVRAQSIRPRSQFMDRSDFSLPLRAVTFAPDGASLATGGDAFTLKLRDVKTGQILATPGQDLRVEVGSLSFSPDGKLLALGSNEDNILLWDAVNQKLKARLKGHTRPVYSVAFSPAGKTLASASLDQTVKLWEPATGKELLTLKGHDEGASAVTFSPDGKTLVSGDGDGVIRLWDTASGKLRHARKAHDNIVDSLAISRDGRTLASGSRNDTVKLWDLVSGKEVHSLKASPHLAFTADGKHLITGGNPSLEVWDVATAKKRAEHRISMTFPHALAISPDGKTLAAACDDGRVLLWDVDALLKPGR